MFSILTWGFYTMAQTCTITFTARFPTTVITKLVKTLPNCEIKNTLHVSGLIHNFCSRSTVQCLWLNQPRVLLYDRPVVAATNSTLGCCTHGEVCLYSTWPKCWKKGTGGARCALGLKPVLNWANVCSWTWLEVFDEPSCFLIGRTFLREPSWKYSSNCNEAIFGVQKASLIMFWEHSTNIASDWLRAELSCGGGRNKNGWRCH